MTAEDIIAEIARIDAAVGGVRPDTIVDLRVAHAALSSETPTIEARWGAAKLTILPLPAPLSLWLATRKGATYDEHAGFLVAAEDEAAARAVIDDRVSGRHPTWSWDGAEVGCIGTAGRTVPRGIILEDFRAD